MICVDSYSIASRKRRGIRLGRYAGPILASGSLSEAKSLDSETSPWRNIHPITVGCILVVVNDSSRARLAVALLAPGAKLQLCIDVNVDWEVRFSAEFSDYES